MKGENESTTNGEDFTLTKSWDQAIDLFQYGYVDILDELKVGMKAATKFMTPQNRRKITTGVVGFVPHVPNAILGLPNSMIHIESEVRKTKAISLVYSITGNAYVRADQFVKSGIAVLSTIHALELRGIRVSLKIMFFNARCNDDRTIGTVTLKDYREHLDLQKLTFPVAHPSMFRRIGFKWLETVPGLTDTDWSSGYGRTMDTDDVLEIKGLFGANEHFLNIPIVEECEHDVDNIINRLNLK
jgi:hypothetical protein